ncbi:MAG: hypothetical protein ACOWWM_17330 [Desulfobacterales bacterium]
MAFINGVNIVTGVLVLVILLLIHRIFRGDVGANRAGTAAALVVFCVLLYLVRTDGGKAFVGHLIDIMR